MKKKNLFIAIFLCLLLCIYVYICAIDAIPEKIIIYEGEDLNIKKIFGISIEQESETSSVLTSSEGSLNNTVNKNVENLEVKLFNKNVKNIDVNIIEKTQVIPIGLVSGIKLYTSGALVVGMSEIKGLDNQKYKPYEGSGIEEGDTIIQIGENEINNADDLVNAVNQSNGEELNIFYIRNGRKEETRIYPLKTGENEYKLGLWVRDSAAGIGTMTYYEPKTGNFAALGHGIADIDTGELIDVGNGEFITTKVLSIIKGENGTPGKIQGSINDQSQIGTITKNSAFGIYGKVTDISKLNANSGNLMDVALRKEIQLGKATMLCSLDEKNAEEYEIEIEKIYLNNDYDNKSMLIKVTDKRLIEKTGGIIQGMSGSPVIQNGKFIGAVTNVLVSDPTQGYVVFGDIMIKEGIANW